MTQLVQAKKGIITDEMYRIARMEHIEVETLRKLVASGHAVIIKNNLRKTTKAIGIGNKLKTKVMSEIGVINKQTTMENELDKAIVAKYSGADLILDITTNGYSSENRETLLNSTSLPVGAIPILQTGFKSAFKLNIDDITEENLFEDIEKICADGVDFIVVHCGLTKSVVDSIMLDDEFQVPSSMAGIVSACAIKNSSKENPLYKNFMTLLNIAKTYDVTLFLASSLRQSFAGKINKQAFIETTINTKLAKIAYNYGVQAIIEAGGNMFADKIPFSIKTVKELSDNAPLYAMSLAACNNSTGYNSIANAIGYSIGALSGLNLLCASLDSFSYPNAAKLKEAIIAAKIAGHCADISHGIVPSLEEDSNAGDAYINCNLREYSKNSIDTSMAQNLNSFDFSTQAYFIEQFKKYFTK